MRFWLEHPRQTFDPAAPAIVAGGDPLFQLPFQMWGNNPHPADPVVIAPMIEWWTKNPARGRGAEGEWLGRRSWGLSVDDGYLSPDPLRVAAGLINGAIDCSADAKVVREVGAVLKAAGAQMSLFYINDESSPGPDGSKASKDRRWACINAVINKSASVRRSIGPTIAKYGGKWPETGTPDNNAAACEWISWCKAIVARSAEKMLRDAGVMAPGGLVCFSFMGNFDPRVTLSPGRRAVYRPLPARCCSNWQLGAGSWEGVCTVAMFRAACDRWLPTFGASHAPEWFERLVLCATDPGMGCMVFCDKSLRESDGLAGVIRAYAQGVGA